MSLYFGTDGVRNFVGDQGLTPEFALKLGWAAGKAFSEQGKNVVLIGKDTRISGYMLESAMEAGLAAAGMEVRLLGPIPTPGIAYLTRTFHAAAGVVISASHNPYYDNGIKFFSDEGMKLNDEFQSSIERYIDEPMSLVASEKIGRVKRLEGGRDRYVEFCKASIPWQFDLKGMKIVVDTANGACYNTSPLVFEELAADVIRIGNTPNGYNINEQCGSTYPDELQRAVKAHQADIGIALDGDGDRVIMIDEKGEIIDGDEMLCIIAKDRMDTNQHASGVAGTLMTNLGAEQALKAMGYQFVRTNVGDRYVMEALLENDWHLGGEGSGHIVCLDKTTTGDGTIAALQVLAAMRRQGKTLHELKQVMTKIPQVLINVPIKARIQPEQKADIQALSEAASEKLGDDGRMLIRPSGTEPVIRVMVEHRSAKQAQQEAQGMADQIAERYSS